MRYWRSPARRLPWRCSPRSWGAAWSSSASGSGPVRPGYFRTRWGTFPRLSSPSSLCLPAGLRPAASLAAALVSDWFVTALQPSIHSLHLSQAFAGLVVVAIAGNAIENVVGIQLAWRNQTDYALSVIVNSPLQIALVLAPALVLLSLFTATTFTLVFAPMLVAAVVVTVLIVCLIVFDGESNWLEGATLIGLYVIIAAALWWGWPAR